MEIEKFIKSLAKKAKLGGRYSTANTYIYTLHSYQKFAGKDSLTFEEITPESIKEYEQYLLLSGKRHNTISL
ncbi:phage integrase SAM-like domain-containing protein, partial [Bacteroides fragilis]